MKTFKKVLASTLAAAMVVTALPVTPANAAAAPKLSTTKAAVYVGQSKTIKVTTPKTWKSVKVKATTSKKSVAKVKASKKKITVKAVKAGKAKVTVKVTAKKSGKAVKKTLKATITVKNPALSVSAAGEVAVGSTEAIKATVKPANTKVTYTTSDATIATVDEKGVVTGVKAGDVTITVKAGKTTKTVSMKVKNYVLKSVAQTKADTFEASVAGATKDIKATDITVKNTENNVTVPVKSVSVDSKDATKVTFATFAGLTDGKTYDVTLDGTTKQIVVSDGKVASVSVNKITIPAATETEIKLVAKDANGIVLDEAAYGAQDASKYDFTLTTNNGYVNSSKLYLNKVGDTATAEVTYKTGKYDANGKPEGNVTSGKVTITAVDQAAVNNFNVKVADKNAQSKKFDKIDANAQLAVGEKDMYAYFQIKDADNNEVSNYYDYSVESSDKNVLMLGGSSIDAASNNNHRVLVTPVKAGTAYLLIKKNNTIVNSVAITVVAERAVATMDVDKTSATLSNKMTKTATVTASFKDQYAKDFLGDGTVKVTCLSTTAKDASDKAIDAKTVTANASEKYFKQNAASGNKVKVEFKAENIEAGTYQYKISYEKDSKEVCAKTITIVIQQPADPSKGTESFALDVDKTEIDNLVDDNHTTASDYVVTANVNQLINGVANQAISTSTTLKDGSTVKSIDYKLEDKDGKDVTTTTGAAISSGKLTVTTVSFDDTKATKNFGAGTYKITATVVTTKDSKDTTKTFTTTFTVKDTQPTGSLTFEKNSVDATSVKDAVEKTVKFVYGDTTYSANDVAPVITSIEGIANDGTVISAKNMASVKKSEVTIKKVTFTVGTDKYSVDVTADASQVITIK